MLNGEYIEPGDLVRVNVYPENREWGYNPAPDGAIGVVMRFEEISYGRGNQGYLPPGIYENRHWVVIELANGDLVHIGTSHLDPVWEDRYEWRANKARTEKAPRKMIRPLPETYFHEGDRVCIKSQGWTGKVAGINYLILDSDCYHIDCDQGWSTTVCESDLARI